MAIGRMHRARIIIFIIYCLLLNGSSDHPWKVLFSPIFIFILYSGKGKWGRGDERLWADQQWKRSVVNPEWT